MAYKQQNILINLKFNTAELERGNALVNRANEATNKLQQSADNTGKKMSDAYRGSTQSILAMQNQLARLKSLIEVSSNPQKVQQLSAEYKKLKAELDRTTKAAYDNAKATKESSQSFGQLFTAIRAVLAVGLIKEVVQTSIEMAKLAGNVEGVSRAFNRAFPDAQMLMAALQRATHGTVSEFELMQRTLQATNLGVAVEQLPVLFEFAAARAQQTGESVDYLVDSIVRGIGRKSILVLDNLGLSATRLKEQFDGASLASQSVGDVTEAVARIAQEELTKMGGYAETSATKVDQLTVSFQKLKEETAKFTEPFTSELVKELTELANSYAVAAEAARRGISVEELFTEKRRQEIAQIQVNGFLQRALTKDKEKYIKAIEDEIAATTKSIGAWATYRDSQNESIKTQREEIQTLTLGTNGLVMTGRERRKQIETLEEQIELNKRLRDANKEDALIDQEALRLLQTKLQALTKDNEKEIEQLGIIEAKKQQIEALQEAIEKTNRMSDLTASGTLIKQLEKAQEELAVLLGKGKDKQKQFAKEVQEYLAYLSDLELFQTKKMLEDKVQARQDAAERERENEKRSHELREYFRDLEARKTQEAEDEKLKIQEDAAIQRQELIKESTESGIQIISDQLISFEDAEVASLQNRLNNLRNFYDEQQLLAGDNDRAKQALRLKEERETAELQKKIAQKQKEARRFSVIIDTAAGIARAFATAPNIAVAIVQAALVAAQGASQLAIINRTQARFAKGVIDLKGPGTGTSDSIHARLSRGESVMTAKETQSSRGILKDIRAKKLNDQVLQNLKLTGEGVRNVGMDDSRLLKKLDEIKNSQPNIIEQSGRLYKQYNKGKDYKVKVRLKNMGY